MATRKIETRRGIKCDVREEGSGAPLLWLHGAGGLLAQEPVIERLARRYRVVAPVWPGWGVDSGEDKLEDMLDFALHGYDVVEALGLERPPREPGQGGRGRSGRRARPRAGRYVHFAGLSRLPADRDADERVARRRRGHELRGVVPIQMSRRDGA